MDFKPENPPERKSPTGRRTRYWNAIEAAKAHPGLWYRLAGEHHASNISTLKGHDLSVRSKKGKNKHTHILWICYLPVVEPDRAAPERRRPVKA